MRLRDALDGKRIMLTGVTGFVGQALLARVLTDLPGTTMVLLVRPRGGATGRDRVTALSRESVFKGLRASGADVDALFASRVEVIDGDLADPPPLPPDLDVLVHCAGDVSFDPPIQQAFTTNVHGARQLLERMVESSEPREGRGPLPHYVHISTAYVAGRRRGAIPEGPVGHTVDWRVEAGAATAVHDRIQQESRTPEVLSALRAEAERAHRKAGPLTGAADTERRRIAWVDSHLVEAGRERARSLGWTDCYTFTKAMAERVVEEFGATRGGVSIVRPSIIESALASPAPGWIQGYKMAEPIIMAYGRGDLPEFPAAPDAVVDVVPIDHVVAATLAVAADAVTRAAAAPDTVPAPRWFHVSSGGRNPLTFRRFYEFVRDYFDAHPLVVSDRGAAPLAEWRFPGSDSIDRLLVTGERAAGVADAVLTHVPRSDTVRRLTLGLDAQRRRLAFLRRYVDLYRAYTESELQFLDDATLALHRALDPADVAAGWAFDTAAIDWTAYIRDSHIPSVVAPVRAAAASRERRRDQRGRLPDVLPRACDVVAVFDMDGTVVSADVVRTYLWLRLPEMDTRGRARELAGLAGRLPGWLRAERRDRGAFLRAVYRRYDGADPAGLDALVDDAVGERVLARASADALRRARQHRVAGHRTVLLTGSIRPLTRPFASLFDEVVAADLAVGPDGLVAGSLTRPPLVGEARGAWLRRYADREGLDLSRSYAYADSHSDAALLEAVGNPVAVRPDVALFRLARTHRWPIVDWSGDPWVRSAA